MQQQLANQPIIAALISYAKDHFEQFDCLPVEFEYEDEVLDFDAYMNLLSEEDIQAITNPATAGGALYPLPEKLNECGESYRVWKFADMPFVPTYYQLRLYRAIYDAVIVQDLHYTQDVYAFVVNQLSDILTPKLLGRNGTSCRVEGGHFAMEIFYMRQIIESHHIDQCNRDALPALLAKGIRVGSIIRGPFLKGSMTFSTLEVVAIDPAQGKLAVICKKRGSPNKWTFNIGAMCPRLNACAL